LAPHLVQGETPKLVTSPIKDDLKKEAVIVPPVVKPSVPAKDEKKAEPKHEALVPQSPIFRHDFAIQFVGKLLDRDREFVQHCLSTVNGLLINTHSKDRAWYVVFGDREYELPQAAFVPETCKASCVRALPKRSKGDFYMIDTRNMDGLPRAKQACFDVPAIGQDCSMITYDRRTTTGKVLDILRVEPNEMVSHTCTTEQGWCGLPLLNGNGKFIALHSQAGVKNQSNLSISFSREMIVLIFSPLSKNE